MMEKMSSIAGSCVAADVTGMRKLCSGLLSRVDDFVQRVNEIRDNIIHTRDCCQLIVKVLVHDCYASFDH